MAHQIIRASLQICFSYKLSDGYILASDLKF